MFILLLNGKVLRVAKLYLPGCLYKNMVEDTSENSMKCICKSCPSKDECMNNNKEWFYCAKGKSKCNVVKKGCICGACPVTAEFKLKGYYYCVDGKAE